MLTLKDIGITFNAGTPDQNEALKNINLTINQGDFITIVGSNGAGKSTLGIVLAKIVGYDFIDADLVIQNQCDKTRDHRKLCHLLGCAVLLFIGRVNQGDTCGH